MFTTIAKLVFIICKPTSNSILTARFRSRMENISTLQCYPPRETSVREETQEEEKLPRGDIVIAIDDNKLQLTRAYDKR